MKDENQRQVHPQRDRRGGQREAPNHPSPVPLRSAASSVWPGSPEPQTDLYLFLNPRKSFRGEHANRRVSKQAFFQSSDLVALRPTIKIQTSIALLDRHPHAETP